ncbi:STAS-like domain-containing protein [Flavobacterium sp. N2038]|uniref:STAS-like domain-containing protein n=1 Tax=Flavobacterium sp. N2038 TaxID=2986829 RepID=UPI002224F854|nr:STAS-like domain-containing protein [Flavobacterium sp. N2038]
MNKIRVFDFDEYPGLRHCTISEFSGEEFYHKILNDAFKNAYDKKEKLTIDLDDVDAYASSFLDEAFGNLVYDFTLKKVKEYVVIISNDEPHWIKMIENETYNQWEERRKANDKVIVTEVHKPWYRLINDALKFEVWEMP